MPKTKRPVSEKLEQQPQTNGVEVKEAVAEKIAAVQTVKMVFRYRSPFIDPALCDFVAEDTAEIKSHLVKVGAVELKTGELLNKLRLSFQAFSINLGTAEDLEWESAFNEYVQIQFGIKASRASEYIRISLVLADYKSILNLEVSKLVEISRLDKESIDSLLKNYSIGKLNHLTFREVKKIVRKFNPKKRDTKSVKNVKPSKTQNPESKDSGASTLPSNVRTLEDFITSSKTTPSKAFASAAEVMKKEIESSEISEAICRIIDELFQWKMAKLSKKAAGQ